MNISPTTKSLILYAILSNMSEIDRENLRDQLDSFYQHGSSGDGIFDTRVRRALNKEVENAQAIISTPSILMTGQ